MWVYKQTEHCADYTLYTVGFYSPNGVWYSDSDYINQEEAAQRVHWLNGGGDANERNAYQRHIAAIAGSGHTPDYEGGDE
jgi:hypothetical protein